MFTIESEAEEPSGLSIRSPICPDASQLPYIRALHAAQDNGFVMAVRR